MERGQNPNIIQGRMPVAVVHLLRFGHTADSTKEAAVQFGTTVGKVDDVKKSRNFAYVTEATRFTAEQIEEGVSWLKRHPKYDESNVDMLVVELEGYEAATEEEAAEFTAARTAARGQPTTTKDGEIANGGGGNRRGGKRSADDPADPQAEGDAAPAPKSKKAKKSAPAEDVAEADAEALLG